MKTIVLKACKSPTEREFRIVSISPVKSGRVLEPTAYKVQVHIERRWATLFTVTNEYRAQELLEQALAWKIVDSDLVNLPKEL